MPIFKNDYQLAHKGIKALEAIVENHTNDKLDLKILETLINDGLLHALIKFVLVFN